MFETINDLTRNLPIQLEKLGLIGKIADEVGVVLYPYPLTDLPLHWCNKRSGVEISITTTSRTTIVKVSRGIKFLNDRPESVSVRYMTGEGWSAYCSDNVSGSLKTLALQVSATLPRIPAHTYERDALQNIRKIFAWFKRATRNKVEEKPPQDPALLPWG